MSGDTGGWEVYAIKYANLDHRSPANFIGGDSVDVPMPLCFYVWLIRSGDRSILIDSGFGEAAAERRDRHILRPVPESLKALKVQSHQLSDVVITHMHYDHAGGIGQFPKTRMHMQECELHFATGACMCDPAHRRYIDVEDVNAMVAEVFSGNVCFHDGDAELAPGVTLHHIGGHTPGMQAVRVMTRSGPMVLASDAVHHYRHIEERRLFPGSYDTDKVLAGYDRLERLAGGQQRVIPGHDEKVLSLFPPAAPDLAGWIARLD